MHIPEDHELMQDLNKEYWMCTTKFGNDRILVKQTNGNYKTLDDMITYQASIVHPVCRVYPQAFIDRMTKALSIEAENLCKLQNRWLSGELREVPEGSMMNPEAYVKETVEDVFNPMFPERYGEKSYEEQAMDKEDALKEDISHDLYKPSDFTDEQTEHDSPKFSNLAYQVRVGGLDVCKRCGEFEAGLMNKCTGKLND